jgi:hypothetical protein
MLHALIFIYLLSLIAASTEKSENTISKLQKLSKAEFRKTVCEPLDKKGGLLRCGPENRQEHIKQVHKLNLESLSLLIF